MDSYSTSIIITVIVIVAVTLLITYFIIRGAVISALRHARHEARVEDFNPNSAVWQKEGAPAERDHIAIAYLVTHQGMTPKDARQRVQKPRQAAEQTAEPAN